jgi:hypothetical protein
MQRDHCYDTGWRSFRKSLWECDVNAKDAKHLANSDSCEKSQRVISTLPQLSKGDGLDTHEQVIPFVNLPWIMTHGVHDPPDSSHIAQTGPSWYATCAAMKGPCLSPPRLQPISTEFTLVWIGFSETCANQGRTVSHDSLTHNRFRNHGLWKQFQVPTCTYFPLFFFRKNEIFYRIFFSKSYIRIHKPKLKISFFIFFRVFKVAFRFLLFWKKFTSKKRPFII